MSAARRQGVARLQPSVFLAVAVGGACSAAWVVHAHVPLVLSQARAFNWLLAVPIVGLTLASLAFRFVRWQFFLRRIGVSLPVRDSARIFVAGLAMALTPAYAGEVLKAWLVRRVAPARYGHVAGVVLSERVFDGAALSLVGSAAAGGVADWRLAVVLLALGTAALAALALAGGVLSRVLAPMERWWGLPSGAVRTVPPDRRTFAIATTLSLAAWSSGCLTLAIVCRGVGIDVAPAQAVVTYAVGTLAGAATLLPAGVGVAGTTMLLRLEAAGAALDQAVLAALLVRLFTVWVTVASGAVGCLQVWRASRRWSAVEGGHFEALAPAYAAQLSAAARERVVKRKTELTRQALERGGLGAGSRVLDAGCGPGWYVASLAALGYDLTGVDLAYAQVAAARALIRRSALPDHAGTRFAAASIRQLPFGDGTFEAAMAVNVLHHVGREDVQAGALAELARVVRAGGRVVVHEINTTNLLFRLYMVYLFPLWKRIDVGTEWWLDPAQPPVAAGLRLVDAHFYTFVPDFAPAWLNRRLAWLESRIERTTWARYGAHFTLVYARETG